MPAVEPLPVRPITSFRFTSSHARAQRSHSTQALWSTTNTGEDLSWLSAVYFELDSSELLPQTRVTLERLHNWLVAHPKTSLTIEGHCDEQGTTEYNIGLGQRRAQAMVDYLARLGTDSRRLAAISYGAERPAVDGHDEIAWAKNRRGEFRVSE